ncbi:MAG: Undecaprenyl-phosphate galactose phosphotransferase, partial [Pseudonocardiales bacterium]|nr:Undecaprenyl-phosphate galactose phosphotransferase [Pseudonocardiales bacterium]
MGRFGVVTGNGGNKMSGAIGVDGLGTPTESSVALAPTVGHTALPKRSVPAWPGSRAHGSHRSGRVTGRVRTAPSTSNTWVKPYRMKLIASDLAAGAFAATLAFMVRLPEGGSHSTWNNYYLPVSLLLPFLWVVALSAADAYDTRVLGVGSEEFQRAVRALVIIFATVGFGSYAFQL